jgi:hypothetical protein
MKKSVIAILMTTVILMSLIVPLISVSTKAADDSSWYTTVNGVLDTDYYSLYPYETYAPLNVGFSKFGELINGQTNVGLEYAAVDPFAPPAGQGLTTDVPKVMWVQGWFLNISYVHRTLGARNVWAMAMFSDTIEYGNDWIRVDFTNDRDLINGKADNNYMEDARDQGYLIYDSGTYGTTLTNGGRKTNGTCVTDPITVLYDGPREFIAICRTTVYDHTVYKSNSTLGDIALVQIAITIRFDKVKKEVNLLKDVKSLLPEKVALKMKIQFSNRGEIDLGTDETDYSSYAHFYTEGTASGSWGTDADAEGKPTVYNYNWTLIQTEDPPDQEYPNFSAAGPFPQASDATYDVAQAINPTAGYVWSAAFWPSLSDWSIDGWDQWWHSLMAYSPHYIDGRNEADSPFIPFYIGEWDFVLYHTGDTHGRVQFRGVTGYGVTDLHDADDEQMGEENANVIDTEMMYYWNQKFNPWDLYSAVEKETKRWLEWHLAGTGTSFTTTWEPVVVVDDDVWDDYCVFSERVIDYSVTPATLLNRAKGEYTFTLNTDGTATVGGLISSHKYKILYSTKETIVTGGITGFLQMGLCLDDSGSISSGDWTTITAGVASAIRDVLPHDGSVELTVVQFSDTARTAVDPTIVTAGNFEAIATTVEGLTQQAGATAMAAGLNLTWFEMYNSTNFATADKQVINVATDGGPNVLLSPSPTGDAYDDVTWVRNNATIEGLDELDAEGIGGGADITWMTTGLVWPQPGNVAPPYTPGWVEAVLDAEAFAAAVSAKFARLGEAKGRYEWVEVGKDAKTVDSSGSALIAEAFDSYKGIDIGIAGEDMMDTALANKIPWVMSSLLGTEGTSGYKDTLGRAALKDDWCTYWPIASSNMIGTGGLYANLFSYYANDFTDAFFGLPGYAGTEYSGMITGIPCWNRGWSGTWNVYSSYTSDLTGYAVIATHKDLNGTVLFDVWGDWGRDTFYASLWLHGDEARGLSPGIIELQSAPRGLTSIILKINYADPSHPTYTIVECLGTISETLWDSSGLGFTDVTSPLKGGIHDP